MVRDSFPGAKQKTVLEVIEHYVVLLTSSNIQPLLFEQSFEGSASPLANSHIPSLGALLLGQEAHHRVGMSEETTCYVSKEYLAVDDPFADFIVHEVAHIFHNCKRASIALRETRYKGLAARRRLPEAGDLCVLVRSLHSDERWGRSTAARPASRTTRGHHRGRQHRTGGCGSKRLESHPCSMRAFVPVRGQLRSKMRAVQGLSSVAPYSHLSHFPRRHFLNRH